MVLNDTEGKADNVSYDTTGTCTESVHGTVLSSDWPQVIKRHLHTNYK